MTEDYSCASFVGEDGRTIVLHGLEERLFWSEPDPSSDRPLLGAILGQGSCLMVDAGASPAHGRAFLAVLAEATNRRPDLVALTHWHWDHSFGLAGLGIPAIAQRRTIERLEEHKRLDWDRASLAQRVSSGEELEFCAAMIGKEYEEPGRIEILIPERSYENEELLDLGGLEVRLRHIESDHCDDATVIYVPELRAAFLGDILGAAYYAHPIQYRPERFLKLVDAILALPADTFLEGHGSPIGRGRLLTELAAHVAVARAIIDGERERPALIRIAEDASPEEEPAELHRLVAFMLRGSEKA